MVIHCKYDELVPVKDLKRHPRNRNSHPKDQVKRLADILEYQGWRYPVKVSIRSGCVTSGHGRLLAAKQNNWDQVPVNYQHYESEEQEYADVIADNAIASWSELSLKDINLDVPELGPDFDIDMLGLKDFKIDPAERDPREDDVPEKPKAICQSGQLWQLGEHRLLCGDCTVKENVDLLMNGEKADMVFTSPPYNLTKRSLNLRNGVFRNKDSAYLSDNDQRGDGEYLDLLNSSLSVSREHSIYQIFNLQMLSSNKVSICNFLGNNSDYLSDVYIWNKSNPQPAIAEKCATSAFEFLFIFSSEIRPKRSVSTSSFSRGTFSNVYTHPVGNNSHTDGSHGATFPVSLVEYYLNNLCGGLVLDLFFGSGSTLIACEKTNRKCYGMEIDPHYCDVIIERWEKYANKKAELIEM